MAYILCIIIIRVTANYYYYYYFRISADFPLIDFNCSMPWINVMTPVLSSLLCLFLLFPLGSGSDPSDLEMPPVPSSFLSLSLSSKVCVVLAERNTHTQCLATVCVRLMNCTFWVLFSSGSGEETQVPHFRAAFLPALSNTPTHTCNTSSCPGFSCSNTRVYTLLQSNHHALHHTSPGFRTNPEHSRTAVTYLRISQRFNQTRNPNSNPVSVLLVPFYLFMMIIL